MNKIEEKKIENIQKCEKILKGLSEDNKNELNEIEDIIRKDNTEEIFILTYLKLIEKFNKNNLETHFEKYAHILSKETINNNFPQFNDKKKPSSVLFSNTLNQIMKYKNTNIPFQKTDYYNELVYINPKYDNIRGFTSYEKNKELAIYILVTRIKNGIIKHIKKICNFDVINDEPLIQFQNQLIEKAEIFRKVDIYNKFKIGEKPPDKENEIYELIKKNNNNYNADDSIKQYKENISLYSKICSKDCSEYFDNFRSFICNVKGNFYKRFPNILNLSNEDFGLLTDFCFFLEQHDFNAKTLNFYINKWNNTFYQTREYIVDILKKISSKNKYYLDNDDFIIEKHVHESKEINIKRIKDINKYSIDCIIDYLVKDKFSDENQDTDISNYSKNESIIDYYNIEEYLKFDSTKEIYLNKIWDVIKEYIMKIFTSKTIKSALRKICEDLKIVEYYDFLEKDELEIILKRTRFFQFISDVLGLTEPSFFLDFVFYRGKISSYPDKCSKLLNLSMYTVTQEHEILGHLNIRIQNYLAKNEVSSPISESIDNFGNKTNKPESGDHIEKMLYGRQINQLNFNEVLYILDVENYNQELDEFRENFMNLRNTKDKYKYSQSLSILLESLNLSIGNNKNYYNYSNLNKDLLGKFSFVDDAFSIRRGHTDYFHPPKERNPLQNVLDDYRKNYSNI